MTSIDPAARRVTTDKSSYDADVLVIALGADYDHAANFLGGPSPTARLDGPSLALAADKAAFAATRRARWFGT